VEECFVGVKHPQQHPEGKEIVKRADRSDGEHEIAHQTNIPALRFTQEVAVHAIGGNGDLRQIVEQVVE
jgi:hypothetical protein